MSRPLTIAEQLQIVSAFKTGLKPRRIAKKQGVTMADVERVLAQYEAQHGPLRLRGRNRPKTKGAGA